MVRAFVLPWGLFSGLLSSCKELGFRVREGRICKYSARLADLALLGECTIKKSPSG